MAENPYVYILVGIMGVIILGHWFPSIKNIGPERNMSVGNVKSTGCSSCANKLESIEQIPGIDLRALSICRQKGLM